MKKIISILFQESYCDVTLACDGQFYSLHKFVLSTCSEYFEEMFERTQCKHPVVVLKDIKSEDLEALLNYMYVGEVNVTQESLSGLIKAAECLKIKGLAVPDEDPSEKEQGLAVTEKLPKRTPEVLSEAPKAKRKKSEPLEDPKPNDQSPVIRNGNENFGVTVSQSAVSNDPTSCESHHQTEAASFHKIDDERSGPVCEVCIITVLLCVKV